MSSEMAAAAADAGSSNQQRTTRRPQEAVDASEMPFLVTHWLRNFNPGALQNAEGGGIAPDDNQRRALEQIQSATSQLASAFVTLGLYGTSTVPSLSRSVENGSNQREAPLARNATFSDLNRRWTSLPSNHLENLVEAAISSTVAAEEVASHCAESNLVHAADEAIHEQRRNPATGRTVQDAIDLDNTEHDELAIVPVKPSILQRPAHIDFDLRTGDEKIKIRSMADPLNMPPLESKTKQLDTKASKAMREYLDLKEKYNTQDREIRALKGSLEKHETTRQELQQRRANIGASMTQNLALDQINEDEQNASRVIAQLERKIGELEVTHVQVQHNLERAKADVQLLYNNTKRSLEGYSDPLSARASTRPSFGLGIIRNNHILRSLDNLRVGVPMKLASNRSLASIGPSQPSFNLRKSLVMSRISHAVTINTHLAYPIYCLRFDKTGRYFVTGADDFLARVFCLGARQTIDKKTGKGRLPQGQLETIRGAVLVCTLRGHAGVITDIDVSSDNCFLATASEDGDCRVWGLKDGAPIAILRGHEHGANMVSWSQLTPYRLTTAGQDGFAKTWDIREAALKRYNAVVGKRPEYTLKLTQEEKEQKTRLRRGLQAEPAENASNVILPPIPARQDQSANQESAAEAALPHQPIPARQDQSANQESATHAAALPNQPIPARQDQESATQAAVPNQPIPEAAPLQALPDQASVPPLPLPPAAAEVENEQANAAGNNNNIESGQFVANSVIDEGVKLVFKFQHGASQEERMAAPGTRSRRAPVNVFCVTRCPLGGHFATGAGDGICRVWEDLDDVDVETVDKRFTKSELEWMRGDDLSKERNRRKSSRTSSNHLLLELKGHLNPITDLKYSNAGDRIMTASQRDGVVRIWSWDVDPSIPDIYLKNNDRGLRHIVIKLMNPAFSSADSRKSRRRAPNPSSANAESKTACDIACWNFDDSKIITSQSQQLRQNTSDILPGSQFLFLWDSLTGHCLLGIAGAHTMNCPVIIPHPTDASVFCSAGADGLVKVWDWDSGKCLFSHKNILEHGQIDPNDRGKISGFLDGAFTPDGTGIVLTDDSGRVSVFDSTVPSSQQGEVATKPSFWMMEQYFSNDYYDLSYDTNGYCVERGSRLPPHLAPHGARCTHSGAPFPENITDAFQKLVGPLPSPVRDCRWLRESIRSRALVGQASSKRTHSSSGHRRGNIMQEFNPLTTVLLTSSGEVVAARNERGEVLSPSLPTASSAARRHVAAPASPAVEAAPPGESAVRRSAYSGRQLSSNYRWRGYEDMLQEERMNNEDDDDDEFQPPVRRTSSRLYEQSDEDSEEDLENVVRQNRHNHRDTPVGSRQPTRRNTADSNVEVRPSRSSHRRSTSGRNRRQYNEPDSDEDLEIVSTNNDPTGPHVADYEHHYFRFISKAGPPIARQWLRRLESDSGFTGRKIYAPQVGDDVVYIPRAHFETIEAFPTLKAPWMHWPSEAAWPVVRCRVRDIRYRFPYKDYYGNRSSNGNTCESIVAILTLEVIGIPVLSQERAFLWPDPSFVAPARNHVFEASIFESGQEEFLIPYDRYLCRLQCIEEAIANNNFHSEGIEISTYYDEEEGTEDSDLIPYRGKLGRYQQPDREQNDQNLVNCGYGALRIVWDDINQTGEQANDLSPWEVQVERPKSKKYSLSRPCLDEEEKREIRQALKKLKRRPEVREYFMTAVDERRYSDYSLRIEVPMHLTFIQRRLDANYYTSRWSVVADVRLIRDNCLKYNGDIGELPDAARDMYTEFEEAILSEEERSAYRNLGTTLVEPGTRRSTGSRSSLENLPPPDTDNGASSRQRSTRIRISASQFSAQPQAQRRTSGRATRSNPAVESNQHQPAHSVSFANASLRGRQSRRQSNDSGASEISGRQRHVPAPGGVAVNGVESALASASVDSPSRRTSRRAAHLEPENNDGVVNEDSAGPAAGGGGRRTRSQGPTEEQTLETEDEAKPPARSTRRASASKEANSEDDSDGGSDAGPPAQKRQNSQSDQSEESAEESNDDESLEADSDQDSGSEAYSSSKRKSPRKKFPRNKRRRATRGTRTSSSGNGAKDTRLRSTGKVSYEEQSSSEFEEPLSEEDEDLAESTKVRRTSRGSPKKSLAQQFRGPARAARKRRASSKSEEGSDEDESVVSPPLNKRKRSNSLRSPRKTETRPWPEIDRKKIPKVANFMLTYLRSMDEDNLFEAPVVETYPSMKKDYLSFIDEPMDFRTIENERLRKYTSVRELQNDLNLVFENCIRYNGELSPLGKTAMELLDMLDDVFENALS